jgi:hypothetical protein
MLGKIQNAGMYNPRGSPHQTPAAVMQNTGMFSSVYMGGCEGLHNITKFKTLNIHSV